MNNLPRYIFLTLVTLWITSCKHDPFLPSPDLTTSGTCSSDTVYFVNDVQPILNANCAYYGCHDAGTAAEGVKLDTYLNVINTGDVRANRPEHSDLYEVLVESNPDKRMPQGQPALSADQISIIKTWILQGAHNNSCSGCDTINLTYASISPVIETNCLGCHRGNGSTGGRDLSDFNSLKDALQNTNLLDRINDRNGAPVMPQGGKMNTCNIDKIEIWYNN